MAEITEDELDRLDALFAHIEEEITSGSIIAALEMAKGGQHNIEQIRDDEEE